VPTTGVFLILFSWPAQRLGQWPEAGPHAAV